MDKKFFIVKLLMGAVQYAAGQLAELDEAFKKKLAGIDSVTQWKVAPDGPNSYTIVKDSKIESKMDAIHDNPTYTLILDGLDTALELLRGKLDALKAMADGKVKVEGDMEKAQKEMFILADLAEYLTDIGGGG